MMQRDRQKTFSVSALIVAFFCLGYLTWHELFRDKQRVLAHLSDQTLGEVLVVAESDDRFEEWAIWLCWRRAVGWWMQYLLVRQVPLWECATLVYVDDSIAIYREGKCFGTLNTIDGSFLDESHRLPRYRTSPTLINMSDNPFEKNGRYFVWRGQENWDYYLTKARNPSTKQQMRGPPTCQSSIVPATVDIKPVTPDVLSVAESTSAISCSIGTAICGADPATADRYEERNDALRTIARNRNLSTNDVATLTDWLASTNDALRVERLAALKNDVMNLLRSQITPPPDFADTLVAMFEGGDHPPAVLDYCIQHLGALQGDIKDNAQRLRIRALFVEAAGRTNQPYAGTALYALAEDDFATPDQEAELRRLTLALCSPDANAVARIAAVQLAGERGYAEALPLLRATLSSARRDAVTDAVCIGSLGLLGDAGDLPLLQRFAVLGPRYAPAAETAIKRIEERGSVDGKQH